MPKTSKRRHETDTDSDTDSSSSSEAEESTIVPKQKRKQGYLAAYSQKWSCLYWWMISMSLADYSQVKSTFMLFMHVNIINVLI